MEMGVYRHQWSMTTRLIGNVSGNIIHTSFAGPLCILPVTTHTLASSIDTFCIVMAASWAFGDYKIKNLQFSVQTNINLLIVFRAISAVEDIFQPSKLKAMVF